MPAAYRDLGRTDIKTEIYVPGAPVLAGGLVDPYEPYSG